MQYIQVSQELRLSRIVQGFWRLTDWNMPNSALIGMINGCLCRGVDTFDVADIYGLGACESLLGQALRAFRRDQYKIVSKTGICARAPEQGGNYYDTSYAYILAACKESIRKLGCEYIDLYLIHREDPLICHAEVAEALQELKRQGLIREAGVSNFDPFKFSALQKAIGGTLRTNQIEWNPFCFEHFNSGMMDLLQMEHVHPMIWSPLAGGALFTCTSPMHERTRAVYAEIAADYGIQVSTLVYAWILKHPAGALPIVGSRQPERLDAAIAALDVEISRGDWFRLYAASGQQQIR